MSFEGKSPCIGIPFRKEMAEKELSAAQDVLLLSDDGGKQILLRRVSPPKWRSTAPPLKKA
jgi:hypothetical protein